MREYIAFISYRHKSLDGAVALKLHRLLERFIVPRSLRKNNEKKLGYVFRDVAELPLSSDLSESIREALDHSQFLIIVSTPDYLESQWCMLELEYFLKTHERDHVLTVLTAGTPEMSFPDLLLHVRDENGDVIEDVEPLAANIVSDNKRATLKLLDNEYLRLIAALLNCSYDTLYRREQRYRAQRILIVCGSLLFVSSVFTASMISKNAIITKQNNDLIEANLNIQTQNRMLEEDRDRIALQNHDLLIYESKTLARDSSEALDNMDRLTAIQLALQALPSQDQERPWVPEAERALTAALGAYEPGSYASKVCVKTLNKIGNIIPICNRRVITVGENFLLTCMDMQTGQIFWSKSLQQIIKHNVLPMTRLKKIAFDPDGRYMWFIIHQDVFCISLSDGELLWENQYSYLSELINLTMKDDKVYLLWRKKLIEHDITITEYDHLTGELISEKTADSVEIPDNWVSTQTSISDNGFVLATSTNNESTQISVACYDGSYRTIASAAGRLLDNANVDDMQVIITFPHGVDEETTYGTYERNDKLTVTCISNKDYTVLWQTTAELAAEASLEYEEVQLTVDHDTLVLSIGSNVMAFSVDSGVCLSVKTTKSPIVGQTAAYGSLFLFLRDGYVDVFVYSVDSLLSEMVDFYLKIPDNLDKVVEAKDGTVVFTCTSDNWALRSFDRVIDNNYELVAQLDNVDQIIISASLDKLLIASAGKNGDIVATYDLKDSKKSDAQYSVPQEINTVIDVDMGDNVFVWKDISQNVYITDLGTGQTGLLAGWEEYINAAFRKNKAGIIESFFVNISDCGNLSNEQLYLVIDCYANGISTEHIEYPVTVSADIQGLYVSENAIAVMYKDNVRQECIIWERTKGQEWHITDDQNAGNPSYVSMANEKPMIAFAEPDGTVRLTDYTANSDLWRSEPLSTEINWMSFLQEDKKLLIITGDKEMFFIDVLTGTVHSAGNIDSTFGDFDRIVTLENDGEVFLYTGSGTSCGYLIDTETMSVITEIPKLCGYLPDERTILTRNGNQVHAYHRYTLDELIDWGRKEIRIK